MAKKRASARTPRPKVQAFIVCDGAGKSPDGKITLYGLFDGMTVEDPKAPSSFTVYARILGTGEQKFSIDVEDEDGQSILQSDELPPVELEMKGVLQVQAQIVTRFRKTGDFRAVLRSGRREIAEQRIRVTKPSTSKKRKAKT